MRTTTWATGRMAGRFLLSGNRLLQWQPMKTQMVFIHGGMAFRNEDDFMTYLKTVPIDDPLAESPKRWKNTLRDALGSDFEVFLPSMPNKQNAKYSEWKIWFERYIGFLRDGVVLAGHSQGGYFLAKYLSENVLPIKVRALYLIAAPMGPDGLGGEDGGDFAPDAALLKDISKNIEDIYVFHSKDDPVVPFAHAEGYREAIPDIHMVTFERKGHFLSEEFPELIQSIRDICEN